MKKRNPHEYDWMLVSIPRDIQGVLHAMVASKDGMRCGSTPDLTTDDADKLAAMCSGLQSLVGNVLAEFPSQGANRMICFENEHGYVFTRAAGPGAVLTVLTDLTVQPAMLCDKLDHVVKQMGEHMTAPPRSTNAPADSAQDTALPLTGGQGS